MATWYMKDGNYPYCEWQTSESSTVLPAYLWSMKDGDYPFRPWQEKLTSSEIPINLWKMKDGDYPYRVWQTKKTSSIIPATLWLLDDDDEYPNKLIFPELKEIDDYPDVMWTQEPNHLPYKKAITYLAEFTDYPDTVWREKEGHYPYKVAFPFLYKFTDVPHNAWVIGDDSDCPYKTCFPEMGYLWDRNIIDYIKPDYYFETTVCIGDRILRAVDLEGNQAVRHISIIPTNLVTNENDYDVLSMLKTEDGFYIEADDNAIVQKEYIFKEDYYEDYYLVNPTTNGENWIYFDGLLRNGVTGKICNGYINPIISRSYIETNGFTKINILYNLSSPSNNIKYYANFGIVYDIDNMNKDENTISLINNNNIGADKGYSIASFELNDLKKDFYIALYSMGIYVKIKEIWLS